MYIILQCFLEGEQFKRPNPDPKAYPLRFRLYDGDRILYFEGVMEDVDDERLFDPLDEYGAEYGCTEIRILTRGGWETV